MGDDIGLVGLSHRRNQQDTIARYVITPDAWGDDRLRALHDACNFAESLYLATCNRVELLFVCKPGVSIPTYRARIAAFFEREERDLFAYGGEGAVERWMLVASSLDSMQVGDAQILGQCKQALERAERLGISGPRLRRVCDAAFTAAKRIRSHTEVGRHSVSIMSLVTEPLLAHIQSCCDLNKTVNVVFVGVGDMTEQALRILKTSSCENVQMLFVNRTVARAQELAVRWGGDSMALDDFVAQPPSMDVLVTSTASPEILFDTDFFRRICCKPLVIDLGLPRDVDARVVSTLGIALHDLDSLQEIASRNREARQMQWVEARVMVDDALEQYALNERSSRASEGIVTLHEAYHAVLRESLGGLPQHLLAPGGDEAIAQWAERLVNRLLHVPTMGLKRLASEHGKKAVDTFME